MVTRTATGTRTFLALTLLAVGSLATVATAAAFLGTLWWGFDRLADLRFHLFAVLVATTIVYGLGVGRGAAAVFAVAAVANGIFLVPLWLVQQAPPAGSERVRVVTLDVGRSATRRTTVVEWLAAVDADVVVLAGTTPAWADAIAASDLLLSVVSAPPPERVSGITVLLREPTAARTEAVGASREPVVRFRVEIGGRPAEFLVVDPPPPVDARRAAVNAAVLDAVTGIAAGREGPVVVVGDLGLTRWSVPFRALVTDGELVDAEDGFGYAGTWPATGVPAVARYLALPVDHVLFSRNLTAVDRRLGPDLGVGRFPLVVDLARAAG